MERYNQRVLFVKRMLTGKPILLSEGTGSFDKAFIETELNRMPDIRRLDIFQGTSRNLLDWLSSIFQEIS